MQTRVSKLAQAATAVALLVATYSMPAAAAVQHRDIHHRFAHRYHRPVGGDDITVRTPASRQPVAAADPFHGPAAIITGPIAIAGTIVSFPFRVVEAVFPWHSNDPRVVVGGPVHLAGQIAGFPFYAINSGFGVPSYY